MMLICSFRSVCLHLHVSHYHYGCLENGFVTVENIFSTYFVILAVQGEIPMLTLTSENSPCDKKSQEVVPTVHIHVSTEVN